MPVEHMISSEYASNFVTLGMWIAVISFFTSVIVFIGTPPFSRWIMYVKMCVLICSIGAGYLALGHIVAMSFSGSIDLQSPKLVNPAIIQLLLLGGDFFLWLLWATVNKRM